ncbi:MAG TPA: maleylacetoacetate isomerase [Burkholderiaceae bacterium]|nr:maleylacetoacetate isomerase [Burkholderiaceae bacterium]
MTLHTYFRSSAAFRVRCALNHKGLPYSPEIVWLLTDEQTSDAYRALNPQMLVPTLVDDGRALNQSLAIIEYLDETKPGPKLLPADPLGRARVRSLSLLIACDVHPINNLRILKYLKRTLGQDQAAVDAWYRHWVAEGLAAFERELARGGTGRYCHGDTVTMADCCIVPQVFNAKRFECPLDAYPTTMRVFDALMALPAFDAAQPSRQPDAARAAG